MRVFEVLFGNPVLFSLRHRILNCVCLLCGFVGISGGLTNMLIGFPPYFIAAAYIYGALMLVYYFFARIRRVFRTLVWQVIIASLIFLTLFWFPNAGSTGAEIFLYFIGLYYYTILTEGKSRIAVVSIILLNVLVLYTIEYFHPEFVTPYKNREARFVDLLSTVGYAILFIIGGISIIMNTVEDERKRLARRNEAMENDLAMARRIQLQLIPTASPLPEIAFYYKPMDKVGGDFFDIIQFKNSRLVGIFLSDVSGHGVPAAFITSMIKTALLQMAPYINHPGHILRHLNKMLSNQTAGNFVTAFYGIYNPENREFTYSNAGHNNPVIIRGGDAFYLDSGKRGAPLAVLPNEEKETGKTKYAKTTVALEAGSKLFFYTDGLVEAVSISDEMAVPEPVDYENSQWMCDLKEFCNLPAGEFIESMKTRLSDFRGSGDYQDDVCMVCLDIF